MNTPSLSVSSPRRANGSWRRIMLMPSTTSLLARHQRGAFGPAAVNVDECQAVHEIALMRPAAVLHQVGLAVARRRFIPVGKSTYRYALSDGRAQRPSGDAAPARWLPAPAARAGRWSSR